MKLENPLIEIEVDVPRAFDLMGMVFEPPYNEVPYGICNISDRHFPQKEYGFNCKAKLQIFKIPCSSKISTKNSTVLEMVDAYLSTKLDLSEYLIRILHSKLKEDIKSLNLFIPYLVIPLISKTALSIVGNQVLPSLQYSGGEWNWIASGIKDGWNEVNNAHVAVLFFD